ncbi:ER lumen protein-retaining receptor erd-2.2-like protein [Drosera capensis]
MGKRRGTPQVVEKALQWVKKQSMRTKMFLGFVVVMCLLITLKYTVKRSRHFFLASETIHVAGVIILAYKLIRKKSCTGLSLKTQELTAIFTAVRLLCSSALEGDVHTLLDSTMLLSTLWVIYMMRFKLKSTYIKDLDTMSIYYVLGPAAVLALLIHPKTHHGTFYLILWAFCSYVEAVSVLPQLQLMQNAKMVEPFTAHYVFALGVSRFVGAAHWIIQVYESGGHYLRIIGYGHFWIPMVILLEIVQTTILADFCYYYVKSLKDGKIVMSLSANV